MEHFPLQLYNMNEWLLLRLFRVVTGIKLAYNPNLQTVCLVHLDEVEPNFLELVQTQISSEFGLSVESLKEEIDYKRAVRGRFINTSYLARKFNKIQRDKSVALMGITNYWLAPNNLFLSHVLHTIFPILGITYILWGISFLTTLNGKLPTDFFEFGAVHEVGHLLGKHGYPLRWLQQRKKQNK